MLYIFMADKNWNLSQVTILIILEQIWDFTDSYNIWVFFTYVIYIKLVN